MGPSADGRAPWTRVVVVAVVLLVAQLLPSPLRRHERFGRVGPDKLLHLLGNAGFAVVLADAFTSSGASTRDASLGAIGIAASYGAVVGRLQRWVPGRVPERADLVAGILGAVIGAVSWAYTARGDPDEHYRLAVHREL